MPSQNSRSTGVGKPNKPYPEFPLFPHSNGSWAKKIRGTLHYFGSWRVDVPDRGAEAALNNYEQHKDDLHAGRKPRAGVEGVSVKVVANHFLNAKQDAVDNGELSPRTWAGYKLACDAAVAAFGKSRLAADLGADDFARLRSQLAKRYGVYGLGTQIQCVRCLFKHGYDCGLLDRPVRFGQSFKKPSKKTVRLHRAKQGPKLFTTGEILRLIDAATFQHRAMILLGINCGFGNEDCARLPIDAVDFNGAVIDHPRPKTGIPRRCPLWSETVEALRDVLNARKKPKDEANDGLLFITRCGDSWSKGKGENPLSDLTAKLLRKLGIKGKSFYVLRHTFRTVADEARDQPAADHVMGHEAPHMSTHYREGISDERLRAVTDHVHEWLFDA